MEREYPRCRERRRTIRELISEHRRERTLIAGGGWTGNSGILQQCGGQLCDDRPRRRTLHRLHARIIPAGIARTDRVGGRCDRKSRKYRHFNRKPSAFRRLFKWKLRQPVELPGRLMEKVHVGLDRNSLSLDMGIFTYLITDSIQK